MYRQMEVLVLNEDTTAFGNEDKREVNEAIAEPAATSSAIIIIVHRFTALRDYNRVNKLKNDEMIAKHEYQTLASQPH